MTAQEFKSFVNAVGGPKYILGIGIGADTFQILYLTKDDGEEYVLDLDKDIVTIGGVEFIKYYSYINDNRLHKSGMVRHNVTSYCKLSEVQRIYTLDSPEERQFLDKTDMYEL